MSDQNQNNTCYQLGSFCCGYLKKWWILVLLGIGLAAWITTVGLGLHLSKTNYPGFTDVHFILMLVWYPALVALPIVLAGFYVQYLQYRDGYRFSFLKCCLAEIWVVGWIMAIIYQDSIPTWLYILAFTWLFALTLLYYSVGVEIKHCCQDIRSGWQTYQQNHATDQNAVEMA